MNTEYVILVDEQHREIGTMKKMQVHREAKLHRAISVFIFNSRKELLLQKRAEGKYHSAGLWTNTCCSHPRPGEGVMDAAERRLEEEMSIACPLSLVFNFTYKAAFENSLTEYEFDHVFFGFTDDVPKPDLNEVSEYLYLSLDKIETRLKQNPQQYTTWFKLIFERAKNEFKNITTKS